MIVFPATSLRDSPSLVSMHHFSETKLKELQQCALGKLAPVHTQWMFERYGTGPDIDTMQGREAKPVQIASYAKHSTVKSKWFEVFRHDFIGKLWLPLQQPSLLGYHETHESLVPKGVGNPQTCHCGFRKLETEGKCFYCIHPIMNEIRKSIAERRIQQNMS